MAFKCDKPDCDDVFKSSSSLWFHEKRVHENMSGKSLRELALRTTLRGTNENVSHKCLDCERIFVKISHLEKHRLLHHVPQKCLDCEKIFTQRSSLKSHRELKVCRKNKTMIPNESLSASSTASESMKNHQSTLTHTFKPKSLKKYKCGKPGCNAAFKSSSSLWHHIQIVHKHITYKCLDCEKIFTFGSSLKKHRELKVCLKPKTKRIANLEARLSDIDSQIEKVAAMISGLDSLECDDCIFK